MKNTKQILVTWLALTLSFGVSAKEAKPGEEIIQQILAMGVSAPKVAPARGDESEGPFKRLIIKNANIIDGAGAPIQGPITIEIENDKIVNLRGAGSGSLHAKEEDYGSDTRVIDASGMYVLPGFIDTHAHLGTPCSRIYRLVDRPRIRRKAGTV